MKNLIVGTVVGGVILFAWGFISWVLLPFHHHTFLHTPGQDKIMESLNQNMDHTAAYMMPIPDNRTAGKYDEKYLEEYERMSKENAGKPYALVFYFKEGFDMSAGPFIIGMIFQWISVFVASIILVAASDKLKTFFQRWWFVMLVPVLICFQSYLVDWNWMQYPWHYINVFIFDVLISWSLCAAWMAWYYGRPLKA